MNVNTYITQLSNIAVLSAAERESITRSIAALNSRLVKFYPNILHTLLFGSYSRNTILPRNIDPLSDVDYMIVFADTGLKPQSYLDRLRKFAEYYYSHSDIEQSSPTIILSLNHIRFELVPSLRTQYGLIIPAKTSEYKTWMHTAPTSFNNQLELVNKNNFNHIKPLIRIMKYWNAYNQYPLESYDLEQKIANHRYYISKGFLHVPKLSEYFFQIARDLSLYYINDSHLAQWKKDALNRLKMIATTTQNFQIMYDDNQALNAIKKLLPPIYARSPQYL